MNFSVNKKTTIVGRGIFTGCRPGVGSPSSGYLGGFERVRGGYDGRVSRVRGDSPEEVLVGSRGLKTTV